MNSMTELESRFRTDTSRTGLSKECLQRAFLDNLFFVLGKFPGLASEHDYYQALAYTVRDRLLAHWVETAETYMRQGSRTVVYLSAEYLLGPHLGNNILNLGIEQPVREAIAELDLDYDKLIAQEVEPGLGNGGLGRLAACFLDSLATLEIPSLGYGIRYEHGIFAQDIVDGWQVEKTDTWLRHGNPWEIVRPEWAVEVKLGGHTERSLDAQGEEQVRWVPGRSVLGVPYDTPILGYRNHTANTLRLWCAEAVESFDLSTFNRGDYWGAVHRKIESENLTKVLYPNDEQIQGKELRLAQQYFFVSCSLQDMLRIMRVQGISLTRFHEKFAVQLNDTHPAIAVAELMRLLVDENGMDWDTAWDVTRKTFSYTNHTLLPEALEQWPLSLFARLLPRHLEIIYAINAALLDGMRLRCLGDQDRIARLSLIDESGPRYVRMAQPRLCWQPCHQRRSRAAHATAEADVLRDSTMPLAGENSRTRPTASRRAASSWCPTLVYPICSPKRWAKAGAKTFTACARLNAMPTMPHSRHAGVRMKLERKQNLAASSKPASASARPGQPVRRAGQAHPRIQTPASEPAAHHRVATPAAQPRRSTSSRAPSSSAARPRPAMHMAKLIIKLINRRGRGGQLRPGTCRPLRVVFMPNFNVSRWPHAVPGRRPVGTDFHRRQGSVRHRQHEVHDERRADHRHAGWRQRRNPRRSRRRELLPVRPDRAMTSGGYVRCRSGAMPASRRPQPAAIECRTGAHAAGESGIIPLLTCNQC
jgi:starch phosphorylase